MLGVAARLPESFTPVTLACLDVALSKLPKPKATFALGIDKPLYFSVHSQWAQLTPKGGALIHVARYGGGEAAELEDLLDDMQPGWREVTVHRRFLPSMIVTNSASTAGTPRPPTRTPIEGVYLAGDWVGDEGMLSDAALGHDVLGYIFRTLMSPPEERRTSFGPPPFILPLSEESL